MFTPHGAFLYFPGTITYAQSKRRYMRPTRDDAIPSASELDLTCRCLSTTTMNRARDDILEVVESLQDYLDTTGERSAADMADDHSIWQDANFSSARGQLAALFRLIGQAFNQGSASSSSQQQPQQGEEQPSQGEQPVRRPTRVDRRARVRRPTRVDRRARVRHPFSLVALLPSYLPRA